jgi:hypothetical protein
LENRLAFHFKLLVSTHNKRAMVAL